MNYRHRTGRVIDATCLHRLHPYMRIEFRATMLDCTHEVVNEKFVRI
jgi:hypothetical protein